jgi:hypothetical protein
VTATQFVLELERVSDRFVWRLEVNVGPGHERRTSPRYWIRAHSKDTSTDQIRLDPIGAVCFALTRKLFEPGYWPDAAETLQLDLEDGLNVVAASNDSTWKDRDGNREPDPYLQTLRRRLLSAVGLTEDPTSDTAVSSTPPGTA